MIRRALVAGAAVAAAMAFGASAVAAEPAAVPSVPFGFKVPATHGWSATVIGGVNPRSGKGVVQLMLSRRGAQALYATTRVGFTEATVTADFGALGKIEVHSVPTGGTSTDRSACGGKPVIFPAGRWEGTIDFHGEEGFAAVEATSATADITAELDLLCAGELNEGFGGHSPGALLSVRRHGGREMLGLNVRKNKRLGPTRLQVDLAESRGWLFIDRSVEAEAGSGAFEFEIPPGRAEVHPPEPFAGSLEFVRIARHHARVTGDLSVDLPGRAHIAILGSGEMRASLVRAVLNPSHPF